jgi:hypothetical protein
VLACGFEDLEPHFTKGNLPSHRQVMLIARRQGLHRS